MTRRLVIRVRKQCGSGSIEGPTYLPTLPVFPGVSKFFYQVSQSPSLSNKSPGKYLQLYCGFIQNFLINFVIFQDDKKENRKQHKK